MQIMVEAVVIIFGSSDTREIDNNCTCTHIKIFFLTFRTMLPQIIVEENKKTTNRILDILHKIATEQFKIRGLFSMRTKVNWEPMNWCRRSMEHYLFIRDCLFKLVTSHHIVHEYQHFQSSILFSWTHSWSSSEGHKCVGSRPTPFKSGWIKLLGFREVLRILV